MKSLASLLALLPLCAAAFATPAHASLAFPDQVKKQLGLSAVPPPSPGCRVCHLDDKGGVGTARTPFGSTIMALGATAISLPALEAALEEAEQTGVDSDRDGVGDIAELRASTDPNRGTTAGGEPLPTVEGVPLPETGCSVPAAHGSLNAAHAWLVVLAGSLIAARRRRSGHA